ncbi:sporulation protein [Bacillus sp. Marseille-Q1617]|uniref:sporulation protein n=1 Tax=Bacillus sp. Marseille-Q1617 TaxID=2736887 RepID=UPI00158D76EB|nr:sporulation protein [Bacillus sp. Marseille-Q1617]
MFNKQKKALSNAKFKKLITRTIGHISVDTVLTEEEVTPGDTMMGEVRLSSKKGFKEVEKVSVSLMQQFATGEDRIGNLPLNTVVMKLTEDQKGENEVILPFELKVPLYTPNNVWNRKCWVQTDIDLPYRLDPRDMDFINVHEHPIVTHVNRVLTEEMGFRKTNREEVINYPGFKVSWHSDKRILNHPLYPALSKRNVALAHELEYFAPEEFKDKYKEVELVYDIKEDGLDLYVEIQFFVPKEIGGTMQRFALREKGLDEQIHKLSFTLEELEGSEAIKDKMLDLLRNTEIPEELRV